MVDRFEGSILQVEGEDPVQVDWHPVPVHIVPVGSVKGFHSCLHSFRQFVEGKVFAGSKIRTGRLVRENSSTAYILNEQAV